MASPKTTFPPSVASGNGSDPTARELRRRESDEQRARFRAAVQPLPPELFTYLTHFARKPADSARALGRTDVLLLLLEWQRSDRDGA